MKPDLDLHLLSSRGDTFLGSRWDCFWGPAAPSDDPKLFEPYLIEERLEVIAVVPRQPAVSTPNSQGTYRVGVHVWEDAGFGPSFATVQISVGRVLRDIGAEVELKSGDLWESHHLDPVTGAVTRLMTEDGGLLVIRAFPVPPLVGGRRSMMPLKRQTQHKG